MRVSVCAQELLHHAVCSAWCSSSLSHIWIGCGFISREEVARSTSPNGELDAVVIETNGGATTSFGYDVYVVPKRECVGLWTGANVASLYGAVRNTSAGGNAYGINVRWIGSNELAIEYLEARRHEVGDTTVEVANHRVNISLKSGILDPTAPAGGMLYNKGRQAK